MYKEPSTAPLVPGLGSLEVGLGVVVRDAIREGVGHRGLLGIFHRGRSIIDNWCWSMVDNWGRRMIDSRGRSVVGNRCGMDKSMMAMADAVPVVNSVSNVGDVRHCGGTGQAKQGRDDESLNKLKSKGSTLKSFSVLIYLHCYSVSGAEGTDRVSKIG